jgi:hypothetical protein
MMTDILLVYHQLGRLEDRFGSDFGRTVRFDPALREVKQVFAIQFDIGKCLEVTVEEGSDETGCRQTGI